MEEQAEQNWVPCLKQISINIESCFAIKWLKCTCTKEILSVKIMGKWIFVLFRKFFPFNWKAKSIILIYYQWSIIFFIIFLSRQTAALCCLGLETCCSYLGSTKHTYISMVKQTISTSQIVQSFSFFFLYSGA